MDAETPSPKSLTDRTVLAAQAILSGKSRGPGAYLAFAGPAIVASIAYMDPGNFATNIQAGAKYGYTLLWVVLLANLIAMLFQALSAKLGIVTGRNLAEMCRDHFSRPVVMAMWVVSEIAAMATDLAEFLGGAIGLALLFKMPLIAGMGVTAVITYAILMVESRGFRPVELIIGSLVGIIGLCYLIEMFIAPVDWGAAAYHSVVPGLPDAEALLISVGIIGATVMPHAVYLHSGLTQARTPGRDEHERRLLVRISNHEVVIALAIAGLVNMAMVMMASGAFHAGHQDVAEIETAYHTLAPLLGIGAAGIFLLSLIASGISSSVVGTMAGQMIMQGFIGFRIPIWLRRVITMVPAFVVVAYGVNATTALVVSQVVLSHRAAAADDRAAEVHRARRHHGQIRQRPDNPRRGRSRNRPGAGAQCVFDRADFRRADSGSAIGLLFHPAPARGQQALLRQEAALVVHLARARHPIAEIDVSQPHGLGARDVIEDHQRAERALAGVRIEERIDHRQPVAEHVGERDRQQFPGAAAVDAGIRSAPAVFDQARIDVAVLDHHGVVEHGHVGHAAVAVAGVEIGAEHRILLGGGRRRAHVADDVGVALGDAAHVARGREIRRHHAHRHAGAAALAGRPVGDRLAAAEAAMGEQIVERGGALADQVR